MNAKYTFIATEILTTKKKTIAKSEKREATKKYRFYVFVNWLREQSNQ